MKNFEKLKLKKDQPRFTTIAEGICKTCVLLVYRWTRGGAAFNFRKYPSGSLFLIKPPDLRSMNVRGVCSFSSHVQEGNKKSTVTAFEDRAEKHTVGIRTPHTGRLSYIYPAVRYRRSRSGTGK